MDDVEVEDDGLVDDVEVEDDGLEDKGRASLRACW